MEFQLLAQSLILHLKLLHQSSLILQLSFKGLLCTVQFQAFRLGIVLFPLQRSGPLFLLEIKRRKLLKLVLEKGYLSIHSLKLVIPSAIFLLAV